MIDFIIAGILYLGLMFVAAFTFAFVTIGITLSIAKCIKRCFFRLQQPDLV
jgi:hypothetical protein